VEKHEFSRNGPVDNLQKEILTEEEDDSALQVTMGALTAALDEQSNRKTDLVADTQDAAVRT
jgi:hypothetical protein